MPIETAQCSCELCCARRTMKFAAKPPEDRTIEQIIDAAVAKLKAKQGETSKFTPLFEAHHRAQLTGWPGQTTYTIDR